MDEEVEEWVGVKMAKREVTEGCKLKKNDC